MVLDGASLLIGAAGGFMAALLGAGFYVMRLKADLARREAQAGRVDETLALTAQEILRRAQEDFMTLAQEKLRQAQNDGAHDLDKRHKAIAEMVKPVSETLQTLNAAVEQIKGTDKALREDLHSLHRETARLAGALRNPAAQGKWGEYILERLLDNSGLIKGVHYETQVSMVSDAGRQRPDVVIKLQDGFNIIVDAKAPVNEFAEKLQDDMPEAEYRALSERLARQVREHVKQLGGKNYWENLESPDFVVLFLPSEHLFSAALRADPALTDFAAENRIVVASPTLMMSLLRVVGLSWRQVALAKNAQDISNLGAELYKRLSVFGGHLEKISKGLVAAMNGYNDAVGSLERQVFPAARRFKELHVQTAGREIPELSSIDTLPRTLNVADISGEETPMIESENKRAHG